MLNHSSNKQTPTLKRQCELLGLNRSTAYYSARHDPDRQTAEVTLMNHIDQLYTDQPTRGRYGMANALAQEKGLVINHKRVRRLMRKLGLEAVYPKRRRNTSIANKQHKTYPYLLGQLEIDRVDQVWCADITYIPLHGGFAYLVVVMDWYSRCVLSWELSNTMDASFCVEALQRALMSGRRPEIFNTDQGSQFTSEAFTSILKENGISISMDGKGRAFDNIMVERLWRTVKYEDVYIRDYATPAQARWGLRRYFDYYNHRRRHSSLSNRPPGQLYGLAKDGKYNKIPTGDGWSVAANAAAASVALRAPFASAAEPLPA
jgi:putative transposase